ncbi:DUF4105 domain-containing protein [Novosphingobium umbonatum]|uniref:lipoprotein N-acyltransferase Lnb domain-containing protein n=1 Tax=Novosphingobium umbonatum TaxID=1908524 RepID=UPI0013E34DB0|nr:DUF4105 domain-containing protein [Novosphingobium umbonatum]
MTDFFRLWGKAALAPLFFAAGLISCPSACAGAPTSPDLEQLQSSAQAHHLEDDQVWLSLLHVEHGKRHIVDNAFFLSDGKFSVREELRATIAALWGKHSQEALCRFPARALWLQEKLRAPALPIEQCPDVNEFLQNASDDHIDLVFAADSLSSPSSFLGHSFLKFSGTNLKGDETSHAVSFYTDTRTKNYPKLIVESFVTGRKGYFALTPYNSNLELYLRGEQRKVWEYHLKLDAFQRRLMVLHTLELKNVQQTYLYVGYNCATVVRFLIQLSGIKGQSPPLWTTPKDVLRTAERAGLIDKVQVHYPDRALVRALSEGMSKRNQTLVLNSVLTGNVEMLGDDPRLLQSALAENSYVQESKRLDPLRAQQNLERLNARLNATGSDSSLSLNPAIDPRKGDGERQISLQAGIDGGLPALRLAWLPASHLITDNNGSSSHETELKLLSGVIEKRGSGRPALRQLTIFGMTTLLPQNALTGGLSGRFSFGMDTQMDAAMHRRHPFVVDGGVGLTKRIMPDIDIYSMIGGGGGLLNFKPYVHANVQIGAVIREIWGMKTVALWTSSLSTMASGVRSNSFEIVQSKRIGKNISMELNYKNTFNANAKNECAFLSVKRRF